MNWKTCRVAKSEQRIILIDADVVSHFVTAGEAFMLNKIFPGHPIHILDKAHRELQNWRSIKVRTEISLLLGKKVIRLMDFPEDDEAIKREYHRIKSQLFKGDGESACLAVARYHKKVLASSNLRDIAQYCSMHQIDYLTTMDFLCAALQSGLFDEERCNAFITAVLQAGSRLPVKTMSSYTCRTIDFM